MWRRLGPWATPVLVVADIGLVLSGLISVRGAVIVVVVVEILLAVTAANRGLAAMRCFRTQRAAGRAGWVAAEDGLSQITPRPVARALLIEARLWVCLFRWIGGRHDGKRPDTYSYRGGFHTLVVAVLAFTVVEGATVESVLAVAWPHSPWPWVMLALHVYGVIWIAGLLASLHTEPHRLDRHVLRLRDSLFTEVTIPYAAIVDVRRIAEPGITRSGLKIDKGAGTARLTYGGATIGLTLDPAESIEVNGRPLTEHVNSLSITADDPAAFRRALSVRLADSTGTAGH